MWCQNPYLPPAWFTVFQAAQGPDVEQGDSPAPQLPAGRQPGAHDLRVHDQHRLGHGLSGYPVQRRQLEVRGDKLLAEKFGLSMLWND